MEDLTKKKCKPCEGGTPHLKNKETEKLLEQVPEWTVKNNKFLKRKFEFKNFKKALEFVNKVGEIAEEEGHHPDVLFGWGYARIELTTHAVKGLSENDFILAAKIDAI